MENQTVFRIMIRRWWIFLIVFVLTSGTTLFLTMREAPLYKAKATYITKLSPQLGDAKSITSVLDTLNLQDDLLGTYSEVAMSEMIRDRAAERLGVSGNDLRHLLVNSKAIQGTKILEISVQGNNPQLAKEFTDAVGQEVILYADSLYPAFHLDLLDPPDVPSAPISPKLDLNLILGCVLGGFLGLTALFLTTWLTGDFRALHEGQEKGVEETTSVLLSQDLKILQKQYEHIRDALASDRVVIRNTETQLKYLVTMMGDVRESKNINSSPSNGKSNQG